MIPNFGFYRTWVQLEDCNIVSEHVQKWIETQQTISKYEQVLIIFYKSGKFLQRENNSLCNNDLYHFVTFGGRPSCNLVWTSELHMIISARVNEFPTK